MGYSFLVPSITALISVLVLLLAIIFFWVLVRNRRAALLGFIIATLKTNDVPDGKKVTAMLLVALYILMLIRGSLFGKWPPDYIINNIGILLCGLFSIAVGDKLSERRTQRQTTVEQTPDPYSRGERVITREREDTERGYRGECTDDGSVDKKQPI